MEVRAARAQAALAAAAAALVPAVAVGDLGGFDARRYHERHRDEFAQLAAHLRAGGGDLPPGLAHLSVTGVVEQPGGTALAVLPQRTGAGFVLVGDATASVGRVPVGGTDRTVRYSVGDGWWWAD